MLATLLALLLGTVTPLQAGYLTPAENHIQAQVLVNRIAAADAELVSVGMHVAAPGTHAYRIIATTLNVVGKPSDPEDLEIAVGGSTVLLPPNEAKAKLGIMLPLRDRDGHQIGALALAFAWRPGLDQARLLARAIAIRDRVAADIPSAAALFAPTGAG